MPCVLIAACKIDQSLDSLLKMNRDFYSQNVLCFFEFLTSFEDVLYKTFAFCCKVSANDIRYQLSLRIDCLTQQKFNVATHFSLLPGA